MTAASVIEGKRETEIQRKNGVVVYLFCLLFPLFVVVVVVVAGTVVVVVADTVIFFPFFLLLLLSSSTSLFFHLDISMVNQDTARSCVLQKF